MIMARSRFDAWLHQEIKSLDGEVRAQHEVAPPYRLVWFGHFYSSKQLGKHLVMHSPGRALERKTPFLIWRWILL